VKGLVGPPGEAEWMLNDGPERKKFIVSFPRAALPVKVKLSARAELVTKQTTWERIAYLSSRVLSGRERMGPPIGTELRAH